MTSMTKQQRIAFFIVVGVLVVSFLLSYNHPFFWDAVSKAGRANWLYQNNFTSLVVPTELNSGHPPLWIASLAVSWKLFGQTLWVSRLLLLLINIGVAYQIILLARKLIAPKASIYWVFLVFLDPTLITLSLSLNNDVLLLFFCLIGLNALLSNLKYLYALALCGMLFANLRGIYCFIALLAIHIILIRCKQLTRNSKMFGSYIVGAVVIGLFFVYQYNEVGWALISKNDKYSGHRELSNIGGIAKNSAAYFKALLDFGRVFLWLIIIVLILKNKYLKQLFRDAKSQIILVCLLSFGLVFFLGIALSTNPMAVRYLVLLYILSGFLFVHVVATTVKRKIVKASIVVAVFFGLITGHFWVYPTKIAQGWDSSLAYLNYYSPEQKALGFIKEHNISRDVIGTNLPLNNRHMSYLDINGKNMVSFTAVDLNLNEFVLFSNLENSSTDEQIDILTTWDTVFDFHQNGVFVRLYKNPNTTSVKD